jgi:hypothetical protein
MGNKQGAPKSHALEVIEEKVEQANVGEKLKTQVEVPVKEIVESSAQAEARGIAQNSRPYCYHCLTHGHPKEECFVKSVRVHPMSKAGVHYLKKLKNTYALTCGNTVNGLGFYYISNSVAVRPKAVAKTAMVRVVEGELTAGQVKAEMERLMPAKMTWVVEEIEQNKFKIVFPSKGEM